nr:immunoglobulin heavy chain junction region [Macaca mulatta]MOY22514.1 immunoglobulin heavy chain junction region [Macaca mulatta]MOY23817.1 immunoglobulin heavy chain junction region [Macaca mulatta]MOY25743.1 immunoglobulin heavy chain junction region [Macaca mulatta]MOY27987.1 immunoglobulin heavy chain junction region [Macaca mulatta]
CARGFYGSTYGGLDSW